MNTKTILIILNVVSLLPILAYPFILLAGVMSFDAPGSTKSILPWLVLTLSVLYPVIIIALIYFSHRYQSMWLAAIGAIPGVLILCALLFLG